MLAEIMGSGQIALPPALMNQLEWKIGDKLNMIVENGELRLRGAEKPAKKEFFYIDNENETNPALLALEELAQACKGAAEEAGFKNEEEAHRYIKEVIRPQVWEKYNAARNA
ncbi:MAG: AbrB/MazE/SpoVT family DNA-binding domain-containing protein [Schwartzia sp.]|nr:AbrB/MazE/SpoVT family DNA-binding domain-containing protein [Schwartzia sp. (in: firmicutes)]MBR1885813.1 AbrB/MazE/SpoVT family DNA-binding domain-containing protein [Schwartzia sp. (in: firmicutes)]